MSIKYRLFLALLGATGAVVLCMFFLLQWSMDRGFLRYVNTLQQEQREKLAAELERAFAEQLNWDFLRDDPGRWLRQHARQEELVDESRPRRRGDPRRGENRPPPRPGRLFLLDADRTPLFGAAAIKEGDLRPLRVDGKVVGYLGLPPRDRLTEVHELRFVKQQKLAMAIAGLMIFLVSAGLSLPLANRLVRPIRALAAATHQLAAGRYATRVQIAGGDELGRLAVDFNALALTLEKNEQARRQWLADISHELRTPLAVLRGEIEAIEDGLRQATPETIGSLHSEVLHLGRLVDDLHQLALSDLGALAYRKEEIDVSALLQEALNAYRPESERRSLTLAADIPRQPLMIFADGERLHQLFGNLLDNALHYTDPGGRIEVRLQRRDQQAVIDFRDSAPGVPEAELEKLFERFYRVEGSRSRSTGGAGLGLAICRNIVEAHGGSLTAQVSPLGGIWLAVTLPLFREGR